MFQLLILALAATSLVSGQEWTNISGGLKHISGMQFYLSGSLFTYIWGVNSDDNIYLFQRPCIGNWVQIDDDSSQVDIDDCYVWGVNSNDDIFKRPIDGSGRW